MNEAEVHFRVRSLVLQSRSVFSVFSVLICLTRMRNFRHKSVKGSRNRTMCDWVEEIVSDFRQIPATQTPGLMQDQLSRNLVE
jgi:hypothetical protein